MNMRQKASISLFHAAITLPTSVLGGLALSAQIGQAATSEPTEIIVTARRTKEEAQTVPISMTVFSQEQLDQRQIVSGTDLATYTPSLSVNQRFGPDQPSFAIRGFTQELRTTASVGFYFAEVVAPRGGGSVTAGDGGGPGAFFDLQNVAVLKGPQGTLFGRNTTGGAIMLTPQEPTDKLQGFIEGSFGAYNMRRQTGVLNVPFSDSVRGRFGFDKQERDGFTTNKSGVGPRHLNDVDYIAGRASLMVDITDALSNYTILSYSESENKGTAMSLFACNPGVGLNAINNYCAAQLAHQGDDFYSLESRTRNPESKLEQWQAINTTTWDVSDDFRIKNILSYADLEQTMRTAVFGTNYPITSANPAVNGKSFILVNSDQVPGIPTNSQTSFVEELQFQGDALDNKLTWQTGLYFENSRPDGSSGSQSGNQIYCPGSPGSDPASFECQDVLGQVVFDTFGISRAVGNVQRQIGKVEFTSKAIYGQTTYNFSDEWRLTTGLRYTEDEAEGKYKSTLYRGFPTASLGAPTTINCLELATAPTCSGDIDQKSDAVTGLIGIDYFVTPDAMLYAKYSRGYRQGSVNIFGPPGFKTYDPEEVDAYEIGAKTNFKGPVPGTFNISLFYNELRDQQIQFGVQSSTASFSPTTAPLNAGDARIQGVEIETSLKLLDDLSLNLAYTFLDTELTDAQFPTLDPTFVTTPAAIEGQDLTFSPHNNLVATLTYDLPLPEKVGEVSASVTYVYVDSQFSTAPEWDDNGVTRGTPYAELPSHELVDLNLNWQGMFGSNFDSALFVTNALAEEYTVYVPAMYWAAGSEFRQQGAPRMWGARLKYNF